MVLILNTADILPIYLKLNLRTCSLFSIGCFVVNVIENREHGDLNFNYSVDRNTAYLLLINNQSINYKQHYYTVTIKNRKENYNIKQSFINVKQQ